VLYVVYFTDSAASSEQFKMAVIELFPKLCYYDFEVLRSVGGGAGKKLKPISPESPIPAVMEIETVVGTSIVYIRPTVDLLMVIIFHYICE